MTHAAPLKRNESERLWQRALARIPSGTQTFSKGPGQFVNGVAPKYLLRGAGGHVWDVDGNRYIDYGLALGPIILGYAYPRVDDAIRAQLTSGITFTLMHPLEVELAERLAGLIPCAEMVRFGKNGSDATAAAVRLARAVTGRERVACCGYHGWQDWYIGSTSRARGVPEAVRELVHPFEYNRLDTLEATFAAHPGDLAAVILEPVTSTPPVPGFLEGVKALAHKHGSLLIFDEVLTGFRWALGGAQAYFGVTPDVAAFGKALANGMPLSAVAGKAELMREFDDVFFSFTFGGEALSLAAALATTAELQERDVLPHIWALGARLIEGLNARAQARELGRRVRCAGYPCWPVLAFTDDRGAADPTLQTLVMQELVKRGILTRAGLFLCYRHTAEDVARTLDAFDDALAAAGDALAEGAVERRLEGAVIEPVIRSLAAAPGGERTPS